MTNYLDQLNEAQRNAVCYLDGPQLVIAGAGSGKTRVLTYKIVHLLAHGYEPYRILALTFTNKAAREMRQRICDLVGEETAARLWMGTFHSIFARLLRRHASLLGFSSNYTIYDTADSKALVRSIIKDLDLDEKTYKVNTVINTISMAKNALVSPEAYVRDRDLTETDRYSGRTRMAEIYAIYRNRCRTANAMDFDDLLYYTNVLLRDHPEVLRHYQEFFRYVLVDEYQDTNFAQHLIISQICQGSNRLCVVGDDAQSIYSFRGANIGNILNLRKAYPKLQIFKLEQNYRSTMPIIEAANALIAKNQNQYKKNVYSTTTTGTPVQLMHCYTDMEEANLVASSIVRQKTQTGDSYDDFAILYRTNAQSRTLEEALRRRNIPYRIYGGVAFYQRKEIKDILAYMRLAVNPHDDEALRRIFNTPKRGLGETTLHKVQEAAGRANISFKTVISNPVGAGLDINSGTLRKLQEFNSLLDEFIAKNEQGADAHAIATYIVGRTGMLKELIHDTTPENISQQENINELLNGVKQFVEERLEGDDPRLALADFLAEVSLATDQDSDDTAETERVTLMTIHASKGLEYGDVYIVGVEENLLPSSMSLMSAEEVEEERRLLYVAITRAKRYCMMSYCSQRFINGAQQTCRPSRFIFDIGWQHLQEISGESFAQRPGTDFYRQSYHGASPKREFSSPKPTVQGYPQKPLIPVSKLNVGSTSASAVVDGEWSHSVAELRVGTKIEHRQFGPGEILAIDATSEKIKVRFDGDVEKVLMLRFAKFKIL